MSRVRRVARLLVPAVILPVAAMAASACGTAVRDHMVSVSVSGVAETQVGVFDHQQGYSRDWAHSKLGPTSSQAVYSGVVTDMPVVTLASVGEARPFDIAVAIPAISDEGYFLMKVDGESDHAATTAKFCRYGEYFPEANAPAVPVTVSAHAVKGIWTVALAFDLAAARSALGAVAR